MSIKNTKRNARSIYWIKYVTCANVLQDLKDNTYIDSSKEVNDKDPKFVVGDHVRTSKYKNIFAKGYTPNWSEDVFVIKKVKDTVLWRYGINDLNGQELIGPFYEKELQKSKLIKWTRITNQLAEMINLT